VTVVAALTARRGTAASILQEEATEALNRYLHPITGGADGKGWPFGHPVHVWDLHALLQRLHGTQVVDDVRLFAADPRTGVRGGSVPSLTVATDALVFSYEHQVKVVVP
jgi:hypothetical protein